MVEGRGGRETFTYPWDCKFSKEKHAFQRANLHEQVKKKYYYEKWFIRYAGLTIEKLKGRVVWRRKEMLHPGMGNFNKKTWISSVNSDEQANKKNVGRTYLLKPNCY